jgi:DNA-binding transcriptional MocR family regulator
VYNSFSYAQKKHPTLKSLDKYGRVIYVGSFSKSLFPGLRIGLIAAEQKIENEEGKVVPLVDEMVKVKAQITNNTSTISQAILGGVLLDLDFSLSKWNERKFESYRQKRDKMVESLNHNIKLFFNEWASGIKWIEPDGGFFVKMSLPFSIAMEDVYECAEKYRVIFCPMQFFYLNSEIDNEIRLTFSNLSLQDIDEGIKRLSFFLKERITGEQSINLNRNGALVGSMMFK